jgi:predicted outer membrane protein
MIRTMKIAFTAAAAIGLAFGAVAGWYNARELSDLSQSVELISVSSVTSDFAREQSEHADASHARQAVLLHKHTLEQLEQVSHESSSNSQLSLAYTRLAMIEECRRASRGATRCRR